MPRDTEQLHNAIGAADRELAYIHADARRLGEDITAAVTAFCEKHGADIDGVRDYITSLISDLVFDAAGPAERRRIAAGGEIADLEDADLRRSAQVVI